MDINNLQLVLETDESHMLLYSRYSRIQSDLFEGDCSSRFLHPRFVHHTIRPLPYLFQTLKPIHTVLQHRHGNSNLHNNKKWIQCHIQATEYNSRVCEQQQLQVQKKVRCRLHYSCQRCTLAVVQHCPTKCMRTCNFREIFKRAFKIYRIWLQANKHAHTLPQCSPASVGLTQARSNYQSTFTLYEIMVL